MYFRSCFFAEPHLIDVCGHDVGTLRLGKPGFNFLDPLGREVLQGENIRPETDPVLIR